MKVVLKERVANLGQAWDVVEVKPGYAQNFLFKKNLAMPATSSNLAKANEVKANAVAKAEAVVANAKEVSDKLKNAVLHFKQKSQGDTLYGSIKEKDIVDAVKAEYKVEVTEGMVKIKEAIKTLGEHTVTLQITPSVSVEVKVEVEEEK